MKKCQFFIDYKIIKDNEKFNIWLDVDLDETATVGNSETAIRVSLMEKHRKLYEVEIGFWDIEFISITKIL